MSLIFMKAVVGLYFLTLVALAVFGTHRYVLLYLFRKHEEGRKAGPKGRFPHPPQVTVQLPLYNEMYVARRLIDAVCRLDYPADRLQVQVLDDSTDETRGIVDEAVTRWRAAGVDIHVLRRAGREGFKAGALQHGLGRATGEFIAIFDADFVPRPDFLQKTIPHFTDPKIGMVQTRWSYLNEGYSPVTRIQALLLDGHFVIEHAARNWSGRFFNFNGTAGVWRRRAIEDAGGWQHDTITEDLDLSYRAQLAGWRFRYLLDVDTPCELPVLLSSFRSQQHRWAKGAIETARKILPRLLKSDLPPALRVEATLHLLNNLAFPLVLLLCVLAGPAMIIRTHMDWRLIAWLDLPCFLVVSFSIAVFYMESQARLGKSRLRCLAYLPLLMAMGIGLAVNNTRAVLEALVGRSSEFVRTPKHRIEGRRGGYRGKKYASPVPWDLAADALLALSFIPSLLYAVHYQVWTSIPFLLLFFSGFATMVLATLWQAIGPRMRGGMEAHGGSAAWEEAL